MWSSALIPPYHVVVSKNHPILSSTVTVYQLWDAIVWLTLLCLTFLAFWKFRVNLKDDDKDVKKLASNPKFPYLKRVVSRNTPSVTNQQDYGNDSSLDVGNDPPSDDTNGLSSLDSWTFGFHSTPKVNYAQILPEVKNRDYLSQRRNVFSDSEGFDSFYQSSIMDSHANKNVFLPKKSGQGFHNAASQHYGRKAMQNLSPFGRRRREFYDPEKFILTNTVLNKGSPDNPGVSTLYQKKVASTPIMAGPLSSSSPSVKFVLPQGQKASGSNMTPRPPLRSLVEEIQASASKRFGTKRKFDLQAAEESALEDQQSKRRKKDDIGKRKPSPGSTQLQARKKTEQLAQSPVPVTKIYVDAGKKRKYMLSDDDLNRMLIEDERPSEDYQPKQKRKLSPVMGNSGAGDSDPRMENAIEICDIDQSDAAAAAVQLTGRRRREVMRYESLKAESSDYRKLSAGMLPLKSFPLRLESRCNEIRKKFPVFMSPLSDYDTVKASQEEYGEEGVTVDYYNDCLKRALERVDDFLDEEDNERKSSTAALTSTSTSTMQSATTASIFSVAEDAKSTSNTSQMGLTFGMPRPKENFALFSATGSTVVSTEENTSDLFKPVTASFKSQTNTSSTTSLQKDKNTSLFSMPAAFGGTLSSGTHASQSAGLTSMTTATIPTANVFASSLANTPSSASSSSSVPTSVTLQISTINAEKVSPLAQASADTTASVPVTQVNKNVSGSITQSSVFESPFTFGKKTTTASSLSSQGFNITSSGTTSSSFNPSSLVTTSATTNFNTSTLLDLPKPNVTLGFSTSSSLPSQTHGVFTSAPATVTPNLSSVFSNQIPSVSSFGFGTANTRNTTGLTFSVASANPSVSQPVFLPPITTAVKSAFPTFGQGTSLPQAVSSNPSVGFNQGNTFTTGMFKTLQNPQSSGFDFSAAAAAGGPVLNFNTTPSFGAFGSAGNLSGMQGGFTVGSAGLQSTERRPIQRARRRQKK